MSRSKRIFLLRNLSLIIKLICLFSPCYMLILTDAMFLCFCFHVCLLFLFIFVICSANYVLFAHLFTVSFEGRLSSDSTSGFLKLSINILKNLTLLNCTIKNPNNSSWLCRRSGTKHLLFPWALLNLLFVDLYWLILFVCLFVSRQDLAV